MRSGGRNGGRPLKMTPAKLRLAQAAMGHKETKVGELGVSRQTLYRDVDPKGRHWPDGEKLLRSRRRASTTATGTTAGVAPTSGTGQ